jgi:hypothetical protein
LIILVTGRQKINHSKRLENYDEWIGEITKLRYLVTISFNGQESQSFLSVLRLDFIIEKKSRDRNEEKGEKERENTIVPISYLYNLFLSCVARRLDTIE